MPIIVVTEGDFAGIDEKGACFHIDRENINSISCALPLSLLKASFDDVLSKKKCIELLKSQFTSSGSDRKKHAAALNAYDILKEAAKEQKPNIRFSLTDKGHKHVQTALDATCPPWISACAKALAIKVFIVIDPQNILSDVGPYKGISTGNGICLKEQFLFSSQLVQEEMIHEVERNIVSNEVGRFSQQPEYISAITEDLNNARTENSLCRYLISELPDYLSEHDGGKRNITLDASEKDLFLTKVFPKHFEKMPPEKELSFEELSGFLKEIKTHVESLPDMYHIASMVDEKIARNKDEWQNTREEIMRAAFPNAWPLTNGPAEGKQLVQYKNGKIAEIDKDAAIPADTKVVLSFKEQCEAWLKEHAQKIDKESGLNTFSERALSTKENAQNTAHSRP